MSGMSAEPWTIDVGDADFEAEVITRSADTPVVVDFWAPWCAPCRALGPLLEQLTAEHAGAFVLARVNVDTAPEVASALSIRSIPAVLGFRDGALVAEFVGALGEVAVRDFLTRVLPTEADRLVADARGLLDAGDDQAAERLFRDALALDGRHARALVGLARMLGERGELAEARGLIDRVLPSAPVAPEAERLAARLRTKADGGGDEGTLRERLATDPTDLSARVHLGHVLAAAERYDEALTELLTAVRQDAHFDDDAARKAMIDIFSVLGSGHSLTERYRAELAKVLYR
jgi:putative thioredoxin